MLNECNYIQSHLRLLPILKQAPPVPHQGDYEIYKKKKGFTISSVRTPSARNIPSHSTVKLVDFSWSGICTPVRTRSVDRIAVQNTSRVHHLRLSLQELNGKALRCVPRNVAMQEPGLRRKDTLADVRPELYSEAGLLWEDSRQGCRS